MKTLNGTEEAETEKDSKMSYPANGTTDGLILYCPQQKCTLLHKA
jgi:hypothetical protein